MTKAPSTLRRKKIEKEVTPTVHTIQSLLENVLEWKEKYFENGAF